MSMVADEIHDDVHQFMRKLTAVVREDLCDVTVA